MNLGENRSMSIDLRTRLDSDQRSIDAAPFFRETLPDLFDDAQSLIAPAGALLPLKDFCIEVDSEPWTLAWQSDRASIRPGHSGAARVRLGKQAFSEIVNDQLTPIALMSNAMLDMPEGGLPDFMNWWLLLRGALDRRRVYRNGDLDLADQPGRSFTRDDDDDTMRRYLEEFGYLHIRGVFDSAEMAAVAADFELAARHYAPGDVKAWYATTHDQQEHLVRMEGFDRYSSTTRALLREDRFQRIGRIPDCSMAFEQEPGKMAAALVKPIGVIKGISDLPWHKDCSLGRHAYECCSLTVGLSVTGANAESGQLHVLPGSHRALIWPAPCIQPGIDLQPRSLPTETGDVTVHLSCTQHMSQAPILRPRKVVYADFRQALADPQAAAAHRARIDDVRGKAHTSVSQEPSTATRRDA